MRQRFHSGQKVPMVQTGQQVRLLLPLPLRLKVRKVRLLLLDLLRQPDQFRQPDLLRQRLLRSLKAH
jgi:hypothetical protein